MIDGYFGDPEATAAQRDADGYFGTGDLGERTADGGVRVVGRIKNVIKLGQGEFVAIDRVEAELAGCPLVDRIFVHPDATSVTAHPDTEGARANSGAALSCVCRRASCSCRGSRSAL